MQETSRYRGRFAPSPTGRLHFGSLVAAVGSYLDARHHKGEWLVRMEDLDQAREMPGSANSILRTLEVFGFTWDGEVIRQSRRSDAYKAAIEQLQQDGVAYPCSCSRKEMAASGQIGEGGVIYSGSCRDRVRSRHDINALRLRIDAGSIEMEDSVRGHYSQNLQQEVGDFVIRRADGLHAYQLAVVVDDAWQQITHVVRGADLLFSTPRQIYLQQRLAFARPCYAHLPLVLDSGGNKLSKQSASTPVEMNDPLPALLSALKHLGQKMPTERPATVAEFWDWAITHWRLRHVPGR